MHRGLGGLLLALCLTSAVLPAPGGQAEGTELTLMTANVGNSQVTCQPYLFNLCYTAVEQRLAEAIVRHAPDVVALQEVATVEQCAAMDEVDPQKLCYRWQDREPRHPVRRLLGDGYTIACDSRHGFECLAVATSAGTITGCPTGALCLERLETPAAPAGCDDGFSVSAASVTLAGRAWRVVNGHPPSGDAACRATEIRQVFEALATGEANLVLGDMNLDPYHEDDASVAVWRTWVGPGAPFAYLSGVAEHQPPHPTQVTWELANLYPTGSVSANIVLRDPGPVRELTGQAVNPVLDHVVTDTGSGSCTTLGEAPGTERLDGGAGTDHRALVCHLSW